MPFLSSLSTHLSSLDLAIRRHILLYTLLNVLWLALTILIQKIGRYRQLLIVAVSIFIALNTCVLGATLYAEIGPTYNLGPMPRRDFRDEWEDAWDWVEEDEAEWYEDFYGEDGVGIFTNPDGRKVKAVVGSGERNWAREKPNVSE
jgi:hypothetical protein